ncbi:MOSC domain-containing protein [Massilia suwonensis]|uniref:MOSC domain-containing protein n=1 Tax=Massilia suwonensis TaxID=648895 RepID=A0ABW0MMN1_9BURK
MSTGRVVGLAARTSKAAPIESAPSLRLLAGTGIVDEVHADPYSPRQLLLASRTAYEAFSLPPHALGENLLLDIETARLTSGTVLQIGGDVRLRMMFQCEACCQLDAAQPRLAQRISNRRGVLARVLTGGVIRAGDAVHDLGVLEQPWPDDWRERVRRVLDAAPEGSVVEYRVLSRLAGIQSTYCRAFPRLLARLGNYYAAMAVPAQSTVALPRWQGEGLFERS